MREPGPKPRRETKTTTEETAVRIIGTWNGWTVVADAAARVWLVNPITGHRVSPTTRSK